MWIDCVRQLFSRAAAGSKKGRQEARFCISTAFQIREKKNYTQAMNRKRLCEGNMAHDGKAERILNVTANDSSPEGPKSISG